MNLITARRWELVASVLVAMGSVQLAHSQQTDGSDTQIEEMTVIGESIDAADAAAPVLELDAAQMEEAPRSTLADFLRVDVPQNITQDSGIQNSGFQGRMQGNRNSAISLRGLGKENNLVLLNGERMTDYAVADSNGWRSADVNATIPRIIIDRTEIMLDGGSAIYGTDAIAGVVNLIPDFDLRGVKYSLNSQHFEQKIQSLDTTVGLAFGVGNETSSLVGAIEYQLVDPVTNEDIGQKLNGTFEDDTEHFAYYTYGYRDYTGAVGGGSQNQLDPLCGNANIFAGQDSVGTPGGQPGNSAGWTACGLSLGEIANKTIDTQLVTLFLGGEHRFSSRVTGSATVSANTSEYRSTYWGNRHFTEWSSGEYAGTYIPVNHPAVQYYEAQFGGWDNGVGWVPGPVTQIANYLESRGATHTSSQWRTGGNLDISLADDWSLELRATYGVSSVDVRRLAVIPENAIDALQGLGGPNCDQASGVPGTGACEWFNPFMSSGLSDADALGLSNSRELLDWIMPMDRRENDASLFSLQALVKTRLEQFELSGGAPELTFGYEYRLENEAVDYDPLLNAGVYDDQNGAPLIDYDIDREVEAILAQLVLPVSDRLRLEGSVRAEQTGGRYGTINPKVGFNWQPLADWVFRGTVSTTYKAPSIVHTEVPVYNQASWINLGNPLDPYYQQGIFSASAYTSNINKVQVANPDIRAQESFNYSFGFDWYPADDVSLTLSYVSIDFDNLIEIKSGGDLLKDPECNLGINPTGTISGTDGVSFQARGHYDYAVSTIIPRQGDGTNCFDIDPATGLISNIYVTPENVYERRIDALDLRGSWAFDTGVGRFTVRPNGSVLLKYTNQDDPDEPVVDWVGKRTFLGSGFAEYRLNMPVSWQRNDHTLTLTTRWTSGLQREPDIPTALDYPDFVYWDINWQWRYSENVRFSLYANNITNKFPLVGASIYPRDGRRIGLQVNGSF